jgi:hypothetical protein
MNRQLKTLNSASYRSSHSPFSDAADLVRTIFKGVKYIHECGIVHRGPFSYDALVHG